MEFFRFLQREAEGFGKQLFIVGVFAGGVSTALMFLLTSAAEKVSEGKSVTKSLILVVLCLVAYWVSKGYLLRKTTRMVEEVVEKIRLRIAAKVRQSDLVALESIGVGPLYNAISTHPLNISKATPGTISAATSVVLIIGACTFIRFYSGTAFIILMITLVGIAGLLLITGRKVMATIDRTTMQDNEFVGSFSDLLHGFKELKMNSAKKDEFFQAELEPLARQAKALRIETGEVVSQAALIASSALFVLLALIVFLLPQISPGDTGKIASIATLIVFLFGPLSEVVSVYPHFTQAEGSIKAIYQVEEQLASHFDKEVPQPGLEYKTFQEIRCEDLAFSYFDEKREKTFSLEPLNFNLKKGEVVFITGGNGSGKSTFLKVLAGLYPPAAGKVYLDEHLIGPHNRDAFRNLFSPIFSDFHLFKSLYGINDPKAEKIYEYLALTEMTEKTSVIEKRFTNLNLSTGQRKRLALVVALMEDKQIMLFDEWASEQDPEFRRKFYEEIVPMIKESGKTLVAVTHDDDYYGAADRVLKMQYGRFVNAPKGRKSSKA